MKVEVTTPEENMGDIIGDISARRGAVIQVDTRESTVQIIANTPLSELFGYATAIRSLTRGRASYTMEPNHFERVPTFIQDKIVEKSQK
jgi:elongation factor G